MPMLPLTAVVVFLLLHRLLFTVVVLENGYSKAEQFYRSGQQL